LSTRFSPDGMYYWDGAQWVSTISHDGRYRWNGQAWVPVGQDVPGFGPAYQTPVPERVPTSWTRPMQYVVAGWYGISAIFALTLPFWMGGQMAQIVNASFQRQQQLNPDVAPPPPGFIDAVTSMMTGMIWVAALFGLGIAALVIVGALKRWTWLFYVVLVLLGLGVVSEPFNLLTYSTNSFSTVSGYTPPGWVFGLGLVSWIPTTALFIWMLIAAIKRGPWAMTRPAPA
jgi:hypothetical protein